MRARGGLLILLLGSLAAWPGSAPAQPVSGRHGTIDSRLTASRPNAPTGFTFVATYHAAGDPKGSPPYMRRMKSFGPPGLRYDTSAPARCSATDVELQALGPSACPARSRVGGGTTVVCSWAGLRAR